MTDHCRLGCTACGRPCNGAALGRVTHRFDCCGLIRAHVPGRDGSTWADVAEPMRAGYLTGPSRTSPISGPDTPSPVAGPAAASSTANAVTGGTPSTPTENRESA